MAVTKDFKNPAAESIWSIRRPGTATLFFLAVGVFFLASISETTYYPAAVPVLGVDGSQLKGPDGKPVLHRDMAEFYHLMMPAFVFFGLGFCFLIWWLMRIVKLVFFQLRQGK